MAGRVGYVTKFALTNGIIKKVDGDVSDESPNMLYISSFEAYHGREWHGNKNDALKHAEVMRRKKIDALKRQIAKLERLKFIVEDEHERERN